MAPFARFNVVLTLPLLALALGVSACALIDQSTFDPALRPKTAAAAAAPAPVLEANGALLTISLAHGQPDYQDALASAVKQALAVKPDTEFQVVSMIPQTGDTAPTWDQAEAVTVWGRRVAGQIQRDGVDQGQITLGLRADPTLDHGEIRVYVQ
jgi:hypothetical protein